MKAIVFFLLLIPNLVMARGYVCDAVSEDYRNYKFEIDVDSKVIRMRLLEVEEWEIISAEGISCGRPVSSQNTCRSEMVHEFGQEENYPLVWNTVTCMIDGVENAALSGMAIVGGVYQGYGNYYCGFFPQYSLSLSDCQIY